MSNCLPQPPHLRYCARPAGLGFPRVNSPGGPLKPGGSSLIDQLLFSLLVWVSTSKVTLLLHCGLQGGGCFLPDPISDLDCSCHFEGRASASCLDRQWYSPELLSLRRSGGAPVPVCVYHQSSCARICNPGTPEAEAGGSQQVWSQLGYIANPRPARGV